MNILLTNDDGIGALGFRALVDALKDNHNLYIVVPETQQSAKSHSITMNQPIYAHEAHIFKHDNIKLQVAVVGTPVDCVKLALDVLIDEKIDLIVSGINHGPNIGEDVIYSGTVGAAYEGIFYGIPGIALSVSAYGALTFNGAREYVKKHIDYLYSLFNGEKDFILNINFPNSDEFSGSKLTKLGTIKYVDVFTKRTNPHGKDYFWLAGEKLVPRETNDDDCDTMCVEKNIVSICPVKINLYHFISEKADLSKVAGLK